MPNVDDDTQLVPLTLTDANHPNRAADTTDVNETDDRPHPNGDNASSRYGRVEMVSVSQKLCGARAILLTNLVTEGEDSTPLFGVRYLLKAKGTFQGRIRNVRITDERVCIIGLASLSVDPAELRPGS